MNEQPTPSGDVDVDPLAVRNTTPGVSTRTAVVSAKRADGILVVWSEAWLRVAVNPATRSSKVAG